MTQPAASLTWVNETYGHSYSLFNTLKTWEEARSYASSIGGYLVSVDSYSEAVDIYSRLQSALSVDDLASSISQDGGGASYIWLGGNDVAEEGIWRWSENNSTVWDIGGEFGWGNGALGAEPDDAGGQDYMALGMTNWPNGFADNQGIGNAGQWNDLSGTNQLYFLVETDQVSNLLSSGGPDHLYGTNLADLITAGAGDDTIYGGGGSDSVDGGEGYDGLFFHEPIFSHEFSYDVASGIYRLSGNGDVVEVRNVEFVGYYDFGTSMEFMVGDVYRFFNMVNGTHFFTGSEAEATSVFNNLPMYRYEGPAFSSSVYSYPSDVEVIRFYNTQTGSHFYTASQTEADWVRATLPQFQYEGAAYTAFSNQEEGSLPLYRFFNTQTGTHFYTVNEQEMQDVRTNLASLYNYEGIAYYVNAAGDYF